jgi:hypothetical protein
VTLIQSTRVAGGAGCLVALATFTHGGQPALEVFCSPSAPIVDASDPIRVRAWIDPGEMHGPIRFRWAATPGTIDPSGSDVEWVILSNASSRPPYRATVRAEHDGRAGTCGVEVWPSTTGRGPAEREAGKMLLATTEQSPGGFGLYSYLLLGSAPTGATRERYARTIEAWWSLIPDLVQLERYLDRRQLNAALLPVLSTPTTGLSPAVLLDRYDYARARVLLRAVGRSGRDGPYLVSSLEPLNERAGVSGPYLVQDLSSVPASLALAWTKEFLSQTAQERFWDERTVPMLGLKMRTTIRVLAGGLSSVRQSVGTLISWGGATKD